MEDREIYSNIRAVPPIAIRVDGRNFKKLLKNFKKPYDKKFIAAMADATELLMRESGLTPRFAYIFSDEINLFFLKLPFQGRIEKLDSVVSSFLASALSLTLKTTISFDAKVIPLSERDIHKYLELRQAEAWRNHVNSYGYYALLEDGLSKLDAALNMKGMNSKEIHDMLFERGINLAETPTWQRRGILICKETYQKPGYDPKKHLRVLSRRSKVIQDWEIPLFSTEEGKKLIDELLIER
ncbi:MAG: tRNA(His) guanylyltransferase Thg1 family protein [Methanocellales archaeon]|nr:tRNA(His) guanylyltransferase Thg1 family protein [Methanocellales archaeon]MDD3421146.1 tRNA(His) guanylyltransferase Thg1 family protein [Methanocellales archaeon]MDD4898572.1 tRNA(His) guanylyltransferase Thg1 family protein [Methanocellales archaeon]MDD5446538.1 tRNA(His) guanylyltransferase Thg1 family protein [Methanocellales archaeon]